MARKVTENVVGAFNWNEEAKQSNTESRRSYRNSLRLELYGHCIAEKFDNETGIWVDCCGYPTNTTFDRLRYVSGVESLTYKKGTIYLNGEEWDGKRKYIA